MHLRNPQFWRVLFLFLFFIHRACLWYLLDTEVWVTENLKSLRLFSVFWSISIMLEFGQSPFDLIFLSPPFPVPILRWLYRVHQLQSVSPSLSFSIDFFSPLTSVDIYIFLFFSVLPCGQLEWQTLLVTHVLLFCKLWRGMVVWPILGDHIFYLKIPDNLSSYFLGQILSYAFSIWPYG